jgi:hypothetical protein
MMASPKRNWKVVFFFSPVDRRGNPPQRWFGPPGAKFKAPVLEERHVFGNRTAAEAWQLYNTVRKSQAVHRAELWRWRTLILTVRRDLARIGPR